VFDPREDPKVWKQEMQAILNTSVPMEERRSTKLADAGRAFAKAHLTMKAMDNYLSSTIQSVYDLYSPDCAFDLKDSKHTRCWEKRDWRIQGTEGMKLQWYPEASIHRRQAFLDRLVDDVELELLLTSDERFTLFWGGDRSVLFVPWQNTQYNWWRRGWRIFEVKEPWTAAPGEKSAESNATASNTSQVQPLPRRWRFVPAHHRYRCLTVRQADGQMQLITADCSPSLFDTQSFILEKRCGDSFALRLVSGNYLIHAQFAPQEATLNRRVGVGYIPVPPLGAAVVDACDPQNTHLFKLAIRESPLA
jgi:hypothetical protein